MERIFSDIIQRIQELVLSSRKGIPPQFLSQHLNLRARTHSKTPLTVWRGIQPFLPDGDYVISGDHQPSWLSLQRKKPKIYI
jgi:hypothetical protein